MDCKPNEIACRLDEIARAIEGPSGIEVLALVVSAMSAAGTLWIAWLNLRLIRQQNDFQKDSLEERKQAARRRFADRVFRGVLDVLQARVENVEPELDFLDDEFLEAVYVVGNESANEITEYAVAMAWSMPLTGTEFGDRRRVLDAVGRVLDAWAEDPKSVDMSRPRDWTSPLDEDRMYKVE